MPPRKQTPAAELIELIVSNAARLRDAGVLHVRMGDCEFHLAPEPGEATGLPHADIEPDDPMLDPVTYGANPRNQDATIPGWNRKPKDDE